MIGQSEMLIDDFDNICRLCLKEESPMLSIFATTATSDIQDEEQQSVLAAKITSIAQVQISPDDGLPAFICQRCRCQVDKFYDFRLLVEYSDRTLRSCFDGVGGASERETIRIEQPQVTRDSQEYPMESDSPENEKDLFSVNAILVPSSSGIQVWQICSAEDESTDENMLRCTALPEKCTDISPSIRHQREIEHRGLNHLESMKDSSSQRNSPESRTADKQLFYTTIVNSSEQVTSGSERSPHVRMKEEPDYEEEHLFLEEYDCQLCMKSFDSLEALKKHVSDHSLGENKRESSPRESRAEAINEICENSGKTADNEFNDDSEYTGVHSCDKLFENKEHRILHKRTNSNVKRHKCRYRENQFSTSCSEDCHEEECHERNAEKFHESKNQDSSSINDWHKCNECGKRFAKKSELRYHKGFHTSTSTTCTVCNKHFRNAQTFKMHLKRHILGSRFNCVECGKSYYTNSELARHIQQHTGTREYPCHLCDMSFLSKPELNRHFKYHNGEKKFECKVCLKTYYESGHLKVHERSHTGERPFSCSVCQKGFITNSKLVRHLKIHDRIRTNARD